MTAHVLSYGSLRMFRPTILLANMHIRLSHTYNRTRNDFVGKALAYPQSYFLQSRQPKTRKYRTVRGCLWMFCLFPVQLLRLCQALLCLHELQLQGGPDHY